MAEKEKGDRRAALQAQREKIVAKAAPLREELDELLKGHEARERRLRKQIVTAESGLYEIDVELASYR